MDTVDFHHQTLIETGDGFRYSAVPQVNLLDHKILSGDDPWLVICSVLEHLKKGDFSKLSYLVDLMKQTDAADVWNGCEVLLSYSAPISLVKSIAKEFDKELFQDCHEGVQSHVATILSRSMMLEAIPIVLRIYKNVEDVSRRLEIQTDLSYTLENEDSKVYRPLYSRVEEDFGLGDDMPDFLRGEEKIVYDLDGYVDLVTKVQSDLVTDDGLKAKLSVFEGDVFSVAKLAERLLGRLREGQNTERVSVCRMVFEASTGRDCTGFYQDGVLQPLAAATIVEEFLESDEKDSFDEGVRYFFGHRIPD